MNTTPNTVIERITPEKAREYFNTSIGEGRKARPVSKVYIQSYADTMRKGRWMLNGVPIIFDNEGHLIDGCHRMLAVEKAGITVAFEVRRGVTPDAFATYDCGRHRTLGQLLAMQGIKHYNLAASIVVVNERLIRSGRLYERNGGGLGGDTSAKQSNYDKYDNYKRDPKGFDEAALMCVANIPKSGVIQYSWVGGIYYYLTHTGGYDGEFVKAFLVQATSIETAKHQTVELLRRRLLAERLKNRKLDAVFLFALIAKTWNAYATGRDLKCLKWNAEEEKVPTLLLKGERTLDFE
jgi:hypothetical protein